MYIVKTQQFEGPMDVLLEMIERRKLDITQVSLSLVTDQFVRYIETSKNISLDFLADFLVVAAKLLVIKSRALLPVLEEETEKEEDAYELEFQLKEYKRFKEASELIFELYTSKNTLFRREAYLQTESFFLPKKNQKYTLFPQEFYELFKKTLSRIPDPKILKKKVIRQVISLEEKIRHIRTLVGRRLTGTFSKLIGDSAKVEEVAVSFLAVLELSRTQIIIARQEECFGDIFLEKKK
ncbi:MAG: segregation/condensation protein A [Candidatus Moraniibacteriota bacterium]|nr:MAG: segregation/condensation protein A [Candidatus Moranbacteria bacterium]